MHEKPSALTRIARGPCQKLGCHKPHSVSPNVQAFIDIAEWPSVWLLDAAAFLCRCNAFKEALGVFLLGCFLSGLVLFALSYKPWFDHLLDLIPPPQ